MDTNLTPIAIAAAINGNWSEAIALNKQIIKQNPDDIDALNRLARAYAELGDNSSAKKTSQLVLKKDPFNKIAQKCLSRWKELKKNGNQTPSGLCSDTFIEDPGKTKIVTLVNTSHPATLAKLNCGDELALNPRGHRIGISAKDVGYIGRLPDDISSRIKSLLKLGKSYKILLKSVEDRDVKIFIREVDSSPKAKDVISFAADRIDYVAFAPPELVHKSTPEIATPILEE